MTRWICSESSLVGTRMRAEIAFNEGSFYNKQAISSYSTNSMSLDDSVPISFAVSIAAQEEHMRQSCPNPF